MYQTGMLCKHFKGANLIEKNIYQIMDINVDPRSLDFSKVTYSGDNDVMSATDLILYANIFQDNKLFVREESDISSELDEEKQKLYGQLHHLLNKKLGSYQHKNLLVKNKLICKLSKIDRTNIC